MFLILTKKIDISKNYSSGKDLQIKKCNNIIPLTTNLMKYIEDCFSNNNLEEIKLISDFCFAYLALVCFRYIFDTNFKKE